MRMPQIWQAKRAATTFNSASDKSISDATKLRPSSSVSKSRTGVTIMFTLPNRVAVGAMFGVAVSNQCGQRISGHRRRFEFACRFRCPES
jgi:hypothetical protein